MRQRPSPLFPGAGSRLLLASSFITLLALLGVVCLWGGAYHVARASGSNTLNRPADPVVLTGASVPSLTGIPPNDLLAFRYSTGWEQVPVQVDERAMVDLGTVYHTNTLGIAFLNYIDPNTWTGPDPNP